MTYNVEDFYSIPQRQNFSLNDIEQLGIMERTTALKLIGQGKLKAIKIFSKWFVPRGALLEFLEESMKQGEEAAKKITWANKDCQEKE